MTAARILGILALLGVPAALAPLLVRCGARIPDRLRQMSAAIICATPLSAPWLLAGRTSPLGVWLVAIAGGIVMLKAIDWLTWPRQSHDLARVWLALTVWPALQIEDVAVPLPRDERIGVALRRLTTGSAALFCGLALRRARFSHGRFPKEASCSTAPGRWLKST